ncbi:MAG: TonB-dependent receptor [Rhodospirillaceae bacterium]|nr:TonB-dependent receptor [Rhodospirillaceae bacterium]
MRYFSSAVGHSARVQRCQAITGTAASVLAMMVAGAASAAEPAQTTQAPGVEEIVVTGSRIVREGYEAPTPVSVLGANELQNMALGNVADAIGRLPALQGDTVGQRTVSTVGGGTAGINLANLRNLGQSRTLVLIDGKRVVGSNLGGLGGSLLGGAVDLSIMPNGLISRIDVVTGGASAVYGSDALAGVINFVLDKEYVGIKGSAQAGISTYGDGGNYKIDMTAGTAFAGGRGHFLINAEHSYADPIERAISRQNVFDNTYNWVVNPAYGTGAGQSTSVPQYLALDHVGLATATPGGLITSGPLKGTVFGQGGTPANFQYGSIISSQYMSGGDWQTSRLNGQLMLNLLLERDTVFTRSSYDLTDNIQVFGELQWSHAHSDNFIGVPYFRLGNLTIKSDNPFIPAGVKAQMTALKLTSFALGTWNGDFNQHNMGADNTRVFRRIMVGLEGNFDMADTNWKWGGSYSRSTTHISARSPNNPIVPRYVEAVDAVMDANGKIVCRVALNNPNSACKPINVMGIGVNDLREGAYPYSVGTGYLFTRMKLDTFEGSVTGNPFSTWAGPVSVAFSAEHRKESATGFTTADDLASNFFAGNYKPTFGTYSVTEGAFETVVPLARDTAWARSFDLNAAVRATDYSVSGYVTTWKVGATYNPIDDVTIRATRSRDIRAPNIGDLFSGGTTGTGTVIDRFRNETYAILTNSAGNLNLKPEVADTTGLGVVLQPKFFPGFGASVDYYNIDIAGALSQLGAQRIVDNCYAGDTSVCGLIVREAAAAGQTLGLIRQVNNLSRNLISQQARGIDFEASYNVPLSSINDGWEGNLQLRGLATKVLKLNSVDLDGIVQEGAGVGAGIGVGGGPLTTEDFRYIVSVGYVSPTLSGTVTMRGIGATVYSKTAIVCTSGCPVSTANAQTVSLNHIDGYKSFDLNLNYTFESIGTTAFFVVDNVFNVLQPLKYGPTSNGYYANTNADEGRMFRAGLRFKM